MSLTPPSRAISYDPQRRFALGWSALGVALLGSFVFPAVQGLCVIVGYAMNFSYDSPLGSAGFADMPLLLTRSVTAGALIEWLARFAFPTVACIAGFLMLRQPPPRWALRRWVTQ